MSLNKGCFSLFLYNGVNEIIPLTNDAYYLDDGTEYKIAIINHSTKRANSTVFVDGTKIGYFRIPDSGRIVIERTSKTDRKLTFHDVTSNEGILGGLSTKNTQLGNIRLECEIEKKYNFGGLEMDCGVETDGGTVLGRKSTQRFSSAQWMSTEDEKFIIEGKMLLKQERLIVPLM